MIRKPLILRLLPPFLRQTIASRFYLKRFEIWQDLYKVVPLTFGNKISMYDLIPGDIISGNIAFNGFYELGLSREIIKLGRQGGLFVDVGANMGYFSLLWASANSCNYVKAFEVVDRNLELIEKNIALNKFSNRISLIPKAVSYQEGEVSFDVGPIGQTGWGGITRSQLDNSVVVPAVRLDREFSDITIDVLKIDVEGADTWVLYGCEKLLLNEKIRRIFFEQNIERMDELGIELDEAKTFLRDLGYTCKPLDNENREWVAYPASTQKSML